MVTCIYCHEPLDDNYITNQHHVREVCVENMQQRLNKLERLLLDLLREHGRVPNLEWGTDRLYGWSRCYCDICTEVRKLSE